MKKKLLKFCFLASSLLMTACAVDNPQSEQNSSVISSLQETSSSSVSSEALNTSSVQSEIIESSVESSEANQFVDIASELKLDETSSRKRLVVTVDKKGFVDGDTTHFKGNAEIAEDGLIKARYCCIDTPESTGRIQPWGKKASNFTRSKLENAAEILIESETDKWNPDSTGSRYMLYVWYRPAAGEDFRLLNLEILQNGLSATKGFSGTIYENYFQRALDQAIKLKLDYFSDEKDPDFDYSTGTEVTLKELRTNSQEYKDKKVRFSGLVTKIDNNTAYVQDYDIEDNFTYGFDVYMGFQTFDIIQVGNRVSFCGTVQYYETGDSWQVAGLQYYPLRPDHEGNLRLEEENVPFEPIPLTAEDISSNGNNYISTYCSMENLTINSIYTTNNGGPNDGAMTLTCKDASNNTVSVRTSVLYDSQKNLIVEKDLLNKTIDIVGIVETYESKIQMHVYAYSDITIR